jgi:hypothetical protein
MEQTQALFKFGKILINLKMKRNCSHNIDNLINQEGFEKIF